MRLAEFHQYGSLRRVCFPPADIGFGEPDKSRANKTLIYWRNHEIEIDETYEEAKQIWLEAVNG